MRGAAAALTFRLRSCDPIGALRPVASTSSLIEQRLVRDFEKLTGDWLVVREPDPVVIGEQLLAPDLELRHRQAPERRVLVLILGFFTRDYLQDKLRALRSPGAPDVVLCVDRKKSLSRAELPEHAQVLGFERRIDARALLRALGG